MIEVELPYGDELLLVSLPAENVEGILTPEESGEEPTEKEQRGIVEEALRAPVDSAPLGEMAEDREQIVIITSDHTRPLPSRLTLPLLLREIRRGNPDAEVQILVATGFHRPTVREELISKFGEEIVNREEIVVHNCRRGDQLTEVGTLPSGGKLVVNRLAVEADLLVSEGFVEPHFFAGFSGGRKSVLPGIAGADTVLGNHCAEFIAHSRARTGILAGNPIHEDMIWAAERVGLAFVLNVVLDDQKRIIAATAGDREESHQQACAVVADRAQVEPVPADIVITTNGGYPLDQNIYQTVKSMTAAESTCREGGVIIAVSECRDGHGGEGFHSIMTSGDSPGEIRAKLRARAQTDTLPDQWEAQILARILEKHTVIMVTAAGKKLVEGMHMRWAPDPESALGLAFEILGSRQSTVTVIPDGVGVIVGG